MVLGAYSLPWLGLYGCRNPNPHGLHLMVSQEADSGQEAGLDIDPQLLLLPAESCLLTVPQPSRTAPLAEGRLQAYGLWQAFHVT